MKLLIRQATIIDPTSPYHLSTKDIFIENGIIITIEAAITEPYDQIIDHPGLHISPGWIDIFSNFCDPGYEYKESLETGALAAAAGGYTSVMVVPNTRPVVDSKSQVEYIMQKSRSLAVEVRPIGAITKNAAGTELAEMYDMKHSGAIAFSDGLEPVQSSGILVKALQYVKQFDGVLIQVPDDKNLGAQGLMNEGVVSTRLGLAGKPIMSEELMVDRDIKLAGYSRSKIHFTGITSLKSLEYINKAKQEGQPVSCSVTPFHLFFCDEDLTGYDTNLKVNPPLCTRPDMMKLREAVEDGTVDCIASHHLPHESDSKVVEFEYAKFGMIGLETTYSSLKTAIPHIGETRVAELLATNAAKIFGFTRPPIRENQPAECTLYQPGGTFTYSKEIIRSKSKNSAFTGNVLQGKVIGIIRGPHILLNELTTAYHEK